MKRNTRKSFQTFASNFCFANLSKLHYTLVASSNFLLFTSSKLLPTWTVSCIPETSAPLKVMNRLQRNSRERCSLSRQRDHIMDLRGYTQKGAIFSLRRIHE